MVGTGGVVFPVKRLAATPKLYRQHPKEEQPKNILQRQVSDFRAPRVAQTCTLESTVFKRGHDLRRIGAITGTPTSTVFPVQSTLFNGTSTVSIDTSTVSIDTSTVSDDASTVWNGSNTFSCQGDAHTIRFRMIPAPPYSLWNHNRAL